MDPRQISWLIQRPVAGSEDEQPRWLWLLRTLLSGIYTIDNMDFVLRDSYMSGYSFRPYDLDRLLRYSFFTEAGMTIHDRGINALMQFMTARMELFRNVYFHRTVRAIDLTLVDLFQASKKHLFPGNPLEYLEDYLCFTESSLLVDVARWGLSDDPELKTLGAQWQQLLSRQIPWKMVCQRNLVFAEGDSESSSIFSDPQLVETKLRQQLGPEWSEVELRVDIARQVYRPHTQGPAIGQNFLFDSSLNQVRPLQANELFGSLPVSYRICRIYALSNDLGVDLTSALDSLLGGHGGDDLTNM
jgi:hypothetical protein